MPSGRLDKVKRGCHTVGLRMKIRRKQGERKARPAMPQRKLLSSVIGEDERHSDAKVIATNLRRRGSNFLRT